MTEIKLPTVVNHGNICTLQLDFTESTFLSTEAIINVQFNQPLFYAQYLNFSFVTKNKGDSINQTYAEEILNTVGNNIASGTITPFTFLGQPTPLILRGRANVDVMTTIRAVEMCGSETQFNFNSLLLLRKTKWGCKFAKSSTKVFTVEDVSSDPVGAEDFYSLNNQGSYCLLCFFEYM